jgi:hypothetical protein
VESEYADGRETAPRGPTKDGVRTRVIPLRSAGYDIVTWSAEGDHGGGDRLMLDDIFLPTPPADKYHRVADETAGAYSILVGIAANRSMRTGAQVHVADLVAGLPAPPVPLMPSRGDSLPMPLHVG